MLPRLLSETDRRERALDQLAKLYAMFDQGLQYPDLKHAARVLTAFGKIA